MGLFDWLFGAKDPIARLRKAVADESWAEALTYRDEIGLDGLDETVKSEVAELLTTAGDRLAEVNLEEAQACRRLGDEARAEEHFELASKQACSKELAREISRVRKTAPRKVEAEIDGPAPEKKAAKAEPAEEITGGMFEDHVELELILASYPEEWVPRYEALQGVILKAFLSSHQGKYQASVNLFNKVPKEDRNDIYYFELGALHARSRKNQLARKALQEALKINPGHFLAADTLVRLELNAGKTAAAEKILAPMLEDENIAYRAQGLMAMVQAQKGDMDKAIEMGRASVEEGNEDPELLVILATMLERKQEVGEAEALLRKLGPMEVNVHLSELLLRQGRELDKLLDVFRTMINKSPEEPRWQLRMAQTYLAKGWGKQAKPMLDKLAEVREVPDALKMEIAYTIKAMQDAKG